MSLEFVIKHAAVLHNVWWNYSVKQWPFPRPLWNVHTLVRVWRGKWKRQSQKDGRLVKEKAETFPQPSRFCWNARSCKTGAALGRVATHDRNQSAPRGKVVIRFWPFAHKTIIVSPLIYFWGTVNRARGSFSFLFFSQGLELVQLLSGERDGRRRRLIDCNSCQSVVC